MSGAAAPALAITADGTPDGRLQAIVTPTDLALFFGEQPATPLRDIRLAGYFRELRELNQRARAVTLEYLTGAAAVEWLARLTHLIDAAIVRRILALIGVDPVPGCWCFCGSSGRGESLTRLAPHLLVLLAADDDEASARAAYDRVLHALGECDYLPRQLPSRTRFMSRPSRSGWHGIATGFATQSCNRCRRRERCSICVPFMAGDRCEQIDASVVEQVDRDFLQVLAHDCLTTLPPLTFYQDAVVDSGGEHVSTFQLERSALRPLVDVGRVFAMAARKLMGRSLLSRHDRHVLKAGFRSILRLLEFTADRAWLKSL
jgi:CBS domain-containing protein